MGRPDSTAPHWLGPSPVTTAADGMYISYGLPTAPFPLAPIPTLTLCLCRVGACPVVGGLHVVPDPARPPPSVPSLPEGRVGGWRDCVGWLGLSSRLLSASAVDTMSLKGRVHGSHNKRTALKIRQSSRMCLAPTKEHSTADKTWLVAYHAAGAPRSQRALSMWQLGWSTGL